MKKNSPKRLFHRIFYYFCSILSDKYNMNHKHTDMMKNKLLLGLALLCAATANSKVTLPQLFQSGMVLQRGQAIPVWGWADPGEQVTVSLQRKTVTTSADADGNWRVSLPAMKAGGPYELTVNGEKLEQVLIGDVWLCSGQSNIDVTIERVYPQYTTDIDEYSNDKIRLFRVQNETSTRELKKDIRPTNINWKPMNKQNAWPFSAVGYFLGRKMYEKTGVPQGIIVNSWGGTPIEAWVPADSLMTDYPMLVTKTRFFESSDYVRAQMSANRLAEQRWTELLNESDPGVAGGFTQPGYDDSAWPAANQYASEWARDEGGRGIVGSIWLRQHVNVDKAHAGKPARLLLGTLFDCDYTYVNGKEVGRTYYQYPPRRYDLPEGLLREGDNVITIRFINKYGTAHFIKEKPYLLAFGDDRMSLNPMPTDVIPLSETWKYHAGAAMPPCPSGDVSLQNLPTTLFNAVVYPLAPYALSGVVWYQGESNTGNPAPYEAMLKKLIGSWRCLWQRPELPVVVVQLANHQAPTEQPQPHSGWAQVREAQRLVAKKDAHVELATAIDLGETVDIHPLRKRELADRIADGFSRLVFKDKKVRLSPELTGSKVEGSTVTLTFDQPLQAGELYEFELAGADGHFRNAQATAAGHTVKLTAQGVEQPLRVRHGWKDNPIRLNARAAATGLPVAPFQAELNP